VLSVRNLYKFVHKCRKLQIYFSQNRIFLTSLLAKRRVELYCLGNALFKLCFHGSCLLSPSSRWRYSPGWALASSTICLQASRFLTLSLHSFTPIFLRSMDTSSSQLIFGLPLCLVAYSFPYIIFFLGLRFLAFCLYEQAILFFGI